MPDDTDEPATVGDVRMSDARTVEWFDGTGWKPYRELPDPTPAWVFRGSDGGAR